MTGYSFAHLRSTYPRTEPPRGIVLHWTGGIRPVPHGLYDTLRKRVGPRTPDGLSVHFGVHVDGTVYQYAPCDLVCLHAGAVNGWTIGIEVVSPGRPRSAAAVLERKRGVRRPVYRDRVRDSRTLDLLDYTEAQAEAVTLLVEQLCDRHGIPRRVPTDADGSLLRREMTAAELASFAGALGHYHAHRSKLDPGTAPLERLRLRWLMPASAT